MESKQNADKYETGQIEETGIVPKHDKDADIGAGRMVEDDRSGTLSDRAGDESFDDDTVIRPQGNEASEGLDDI
ncbi:MAG TPA: hypothetical protein VF676_01300 [Flavobacterium sp.]|jgi:hypothetical protein